jgi:hypothetical protein
MQKSMRGKNTMRQEDWRQENEERLKPGHQRVLVSSL